MGACMKPPRLAIVTSLCKGMTLYTHIHLRKDKFTANKSVIVAQQISQVRFLVEATLSAVCSDLCFDVLNINIYKSFLFWESKSSIEITFTLKLRSHDPILILYVLIFIFFQGMGYLHARGIIHKDLKTKNIFLENGKVVITDFGLFSVTKLCFGNKLVLFYYFIILINYIIIHKILCTVQVKVIHQQHKNIN